jgi:hypothetical protein
MADWAYRQTQSKKRVRDENTNRQRLRRVLESRVQHGAKKTEVKICLPGRAVQNTEQRR